MVMEKVYAVIDLKSFYAGVECAERGLDPFTTPLVVCDERRGDGTIIMAVTPYLKAKGLNNVMRKFDLPKGINYIFAKPRMELYIQRSTEFNALLLNYFAKEDWYPYSIDETFVHLTPYLELYKKTPEALIEFIIKEIYDHFKLYVTVGIAPNMFLSKCVLDLEAKKDPRFYARWTMEDVQNKLWHVKPLHKIWGIGKRYEKRLNKLGLFSMGDIAKYPKTKMKEEFGIIGEQLWEHAHGIDNTDLSKTYIPLDKSLTSGQVLMRDYTGDEVPVLIREMTDELCMRMRKNNLKAKKVALHILTSKPESTSFSKSMSLLLPTSGNTELYKAFMEVYKRFPLDGTSVRALHLSVSGLTNDPYEQLSLIEDYVTQNTKEQKLWETIDDLHERFGKDKIMRANALTKASTYLRRTTQIGGHNK